MACAQRRRARREADRTSSSPSRAASGSSPRPVDLNALSRGMRDLLRAPWAAASASRPCCAAGLWPALVDPTQLELVDPQPGDQRARRHGGRRHAHGRDRQRHARAADRPEEPPPGDYVLSLSPTPARGMTPDGAAPRCSSPSSPPRRSARAPASASARSTASPSSRAAASASTARRRGHDRCGSTCRAPSAARAERTIAAGRAVAHARPLRRSCWSMTTGRSRGHGRRCCSDLGYRGDRGGQRRRALELLDAAERVDLLLVDFAMPGMNGVEVAAQAQRAPARACRSCSSPATPTPRPWPPPATTASCASPSSNSDLAAKLRSALRVYGLADG